MKVCTCVLLLGIFAYTRSFASNTPKSNQRSVNLALETVLEFSNKDKEVDIKFLNNVQNFITKVKTVIEDNSNGNNLRRHFKVPRVETFTRFIQDVIHILNTYEDMAFADFFDILDEEIRNYHYRGCRFYELTESYEIRKLIAAKLDSIKGKPIYVTRANINVLSDMLRDGNYDRNVKDMVYYINSLYRQSAGEKFQKVIQDLEAYGRSKSKRANNNLGKIIKNGVRSIIFDHYTNLNTNVRKDFKQQIETFCKQLENNPSTKSRNNSKNSENISNEVKKTEPVSRKDLMNIARKRANKNVEIESEYNKAVITQYDLKNEKKRSKLSRKDTVGELLDIQDNETLLSSPLIGPMDQRRTKNEHQNRPNIDSLSDESFSSIEFYHEPQDNIQQYTTIITIKPSQKPLMNFTKKPERVEALIVTTILPKTNTVKKIWIEESTGRLPKAVLDKLAIKPSQNGSRHNVSDSLLNKRPKHKKKYDKDQKKWHGKRHDPKYVKINGTKYDKKHYKKRKTSEPNDPFILVHNRDFFRHNYVRTTDSVFNMEVHQYKKNMGPIKAEFKPINRWGTASTKVQKFLKVLDVLMPSKSVQTIKSPEVRRAAALRVKSNEIRRMRKTQQTSPPPPTNSFMGRLSVAVPRPYSKKNKMSSWKSAEYPSSSNEGMTVEKSVMKDDKIRHGQNAKIISSSLEKDQSVIKSINNIEKRWNEVKSRINVNTGVVKARKVTSSTYVEKDNIVKGKQSKIRLRSGVKIIPNYFKGKTDKPKKAGTADNKTERKNVKDENFTNNEIGNDLEKGKKSKTKLRSHINAIPNYSEDSIDKTEDNKTEDNKAAVKDIHFKNKERIVVNGHQTMDAIQKEYKKTETSRTHIVDVAPKANGRGFKVVMNDYDGGDASKETGTQIRETASLSTSTKVTESITETTTTVQPAVAVTTPDNLTLTTISVSTSGATSHKVADVLQKAEFNATADESKNQMAGNTSQIADVSKTTLNVTMEVSSELIIKNVTNLQSDITLTTSYYQEKI